LTDQLRGPFRGLFAAALAALMLVGCGGPTPPPPPSAATSQSASQIPIGSTPPDGGLAPSGAPPQGTPPAGSDDSNAGSDLIGSASQPLLPGLYVPYGIGVRSTDHFAFVQSPTDCDTLVDILDSGEWHVAKRASVPIPTAEPSTPPLPDIAPIEWLLLKSADEAAYARVGGDETGCVAQVWRLPRLSYAASGDALTTSGDASEFQVLCAAGSGVATFGAMYVGQDGFVVSLNSTVPLVVGSHPIDKDTELSMGQTAFGVDDIFSMFYEQTSDGQVQDSPVAEFGPSNPEAGWEGEAEVTTIEPLTGTLHLQALRNEAGDSENLDIDFRCDLPPGQLTRAAENPAPTGSPSPTPGEPNELTLTIAEGPHAGTEHFTGADVTCSFNLFGKDEYLVSYAPSVEVADGDLSYVSVNVPKSGDKASVSMTYQGDDFEHDYFNTDNSPGTLTEAAGGVQIEASGHSAGTDFNISVNCNSVDRF
jgi:hypothetical protein